METYTFIKSTDPENYPNPILAISVEIEEMRVSDTYDHFGQGVSPADAGDFIEILNQKALAVANKAYQEFEDEDEDEKIVIGDLISDYDDGNTFSALNSSADLEDGVDIHYHASTCKGFNFWNGSNWQSVVVEYEHDGHNDYEVVENDSLESEIDSKKWIKDVFGRKVYESKNFWIIDDFRQGSFASYELYAKEEYSLKDIV